MTQTEGEIDLLVVGGGINGCGIARDAAGRGMSVVLCEMGDLAGATSSASTKLIHGGLRYLERLEFRLVREALAEREVLLASAPHIVHPMRFVLPCQRGLRPRWMLRAGLLLYDRLGGPRSLPASEPLDLRVDPAGAPLKPAFRRGFAYSDCWADDARLTVLIALDAAERGAAILTRTRLVSARRDAGLWRAELRGEDGSERTIFARAVVNAAGPWVDEVARAFGRPRAGRSVKLVKGSHIVTRRLYKGAQAYTLQGRDRRVVFAAPYEGRFTLIGATDVPVEGPPGSVEASAGEIAYLCEAAGRYFNKPLAPQDVVWSYAGVRPLQDDGRKDASAVTRDYRLDLDVEGGAPLLCVYGGKLTTFRKLAEHALALLAPRLGITAPVWTHAATLPGGELPQGFDAFQAEVGQRMFWLTGYQLSRLCRAYGSRLPAVTGDARSPAEMGESFGAGLCAREVAYLKRVEWARTPQDVLWRRTKLGLHMTPAQRDAFAAAFERL